MEKYELVDKDGNKTGKILNNIEVSNPDNIPDGFYLSVVGVVIINENNEQRLNIKRQLKLYVIRWYKIYAVIQIEIKKGHNAIKIAYDAICFGAPFHIFFPIIILGLLPNIISCKLLLKLR